MRRLVVVLFVMPWVAHAELSLWGGFGGAWSHASDVHLQAGGDDLRFDDVEWDKEPFTRPLYFSVRVSWIPRRNFGLLLELVHDKVYAQLNETVRVTGTRSGAAIDTHERLGDTFGGLSMSHGLNLLAVGGIARWTPCADPPCVGIEPYVFASGGPLIPHVEVTLAGGKVDEYQLGGFGLSGGGGVALAPIRWLAVFGEYRFTAGWTDVDVAGGELDTYVATHQLVFGLAVRTPL